MKARSQKREITNLWKNPKSYNANKRPCFCFTFYLASTGLKPKSKTNNQFLSLAFGKQESWLVRKWTKRRNHVLRSFFGFWCVEKIKKNITEPIKNNDWKPKAGKIRLWKNELEDEKSYSEEFFLASGVLRRSSIFIYYTSQ